MFDTRKLTHMNLAPVAAAAALALAGCESLSTQPDQAAPSDPAPRDAQSIAAGFAQFSDLAVPAGAKMDVERTLVLGGRDAWIGRLAITTGLGPPQAYDFMLREMPKFGWAEITTVRSEVSVLTYSRGDRVATVQIRGQTLGGSKIDVTVSPRGRIGPPPVERMPAPAPSQ